MLKKAIILLCILLLSTVGFAQSDTTATTLVALNMRGAPNAHGAVITKLPVGATVVVEGRDKTIGWLLVHTQDGSARGWMAIQYLRLDQAERLKELPDLTDID